MKRYKLNKRAIIADYGKLLYRALTDEVIGRYYYLKEGETPEMFVEKDDPIALQKLEKLQSILKK